jgi:hypothetical protein
MTCSNLKHIYVFKVGDAFNLPMRLLDENVPISLSGSVVITAALQTDKGRYICDLVCVPYADQLVDTGWFYLNKSDTSNWPIGEVALDVKVNISNAYKHSVSFQFTTTSPVT